MFDIKRIIAAAAVVAVAFTLSACGGDETPEEITPPAQTQEPTETETEPGSEVPGQEVTVDEDGNEIVVITVDDQEYTFTQTDGSWTHDDYTRLHHLILSSNGYWSASFGANNLIERPNEYEDTTCGGRKFGSDCSFSTAFGYTDDVQFVDTDEADRCVLFIQFEDRFSFDASFWVISATGEASQDAAQDTLAVTVEERYGESPTRDELYAFGQDALPCGGVAVGP